MRRTTLFGPLVALSCAATVPLAGQTAGTSPRAGADAATVAAAARIRSDISWLADDARDGRGVGTAGLDSAAQYLARAFARIGLDRPWSSGYLQAFRIDSSAPAAAHTGVGGDAVENVVGVLPGRGSMAGQVVVVGAHYDHLGFGGFGALDDPDSTGTVHNGADDNASGTAAVLEIARMLRRREAPNRRTIVFIAFTGEELGLIGSSHYVQHPVFPDDSTFAMVNFDMVGRLRGEKLTIFGVKTAEEFPGLVDSLNRRYRFHLAASGDGWGASDQASFYGAHIPVLFFFTGMHEDYHRSTDDVAKINAAGEARVAAFGADLVWSLATRATPLTFVDIPAPPPSAYATGGGAWLGTVPDMTESPGGVRLSGVRAGSPAETAGIKAGDIITLIGDTTVTDLYAMTRALGAYKPGDVVKVRVLRGGTPLEFTVTLGRRGG